MRLILHIWDMTQSDIWDMTHSDIRDMTSDTRDMRHASFALMRHDSIGHMRHDSFRNMRYDSFRCVTPWIEFFLNASTCHTCEIWLIHIYETYETLRRMRYDSIKQMRHDSFRHMRHDSFRCVTPRIERVADATHLRHWFICVTLRIHMRDICDMTHSSIRHDPFIPGTWLILVENFKFTHLWHDSLRCVPGPIHTCDMTHSDAWHV